MQYAGKFFERLRNIITKKIFDARVCISEEIFSKELYMNYDQMKYMKKGGMFLGVHGYEHYWMNKLTPEELKKDINKGLEHMSELIGLACWVINYLLPEKIVVNINFQD